MGERDTNRESLSNFYGAWTAKVLGADASPGTHPVCDTWGLATAYTVGSNFLSHDHQPHTCVPFQMFLFDLINLALKHKPRC